MRTLPLAILVVTAAISMPTAEGQSTVAIRGATVIDGTGAPGRARQTIIVRNDRIAAVGPTASTPIPRGARVIEARGLFVVPGFIDMHAHYALGPVTIDQSKTPATMRMAYDHAASLASLRTLLGFGITTLRNPAGPTLQSVAIRDSVRLGLLRGPRIYTAGEVLDLTTAEGLVSTVRTADEVRAEVARQVSLGVDYIKLYALLRPELIRAGIDEAHRLGVRALAHLYLTSWTDAARMGLDGIVHIVPGTAELLPSDQRQAFQKRFRGTQFMIEWFNFVDVKSPEIQEMTRTMVERRVSVDPTLVVFEAMAWGDSARITTSPDLRYAPPSVLAGWKGFTLTIGWTPDDFAESRRAWPKVLAFTKHLYDAGILLTAGTDMGNPWTVPGASFHRELELLVAAGIPPLAVLSIATRNGAQSLNILSDVGTISVGKVADLVALTGDPTSDIGNTRRIAWVMQGGALVPRDLLAQGR
jgi:imidazolonepropionase-like amidohydrolase